MQIKKSRKVLTYLFLTIILAIVLFPLYYAGVMSSLPDEEIYVYPPKFFPGANFFDNLVRAWNNVKMGKLMFNSLFTATSVAFAKIFFSIIAAFAFTYFGNFKGKGFFFALILITHMLPLPIRIVPTFELVKRFDWVNTYYALTFPFFASATGTLLFRQLFLTVPGSLVDSARIDGAGPMRFLFQILIPLSKTNIGALFLIEFLYIWNEYLWPLIITNTNDMRVVQIGLKMLLASEAMAADWNIIMAGTILAILPPLIILMIFQNTFMVGFGLKEEK